MMNLDGVPAFALMKARMQMLGMRQKILAENVANVSTPRYTPRDVNFDKFTKALHGVAFKKLQTGQGLDTMRTHGAHMSGILPPRSSVKLMQAPDSETTLDGNSVVVEEQMDRIAQTRMEFETLIGLYRKSLTMLRMSARDPLS